MASRRTDRPAVRVNTHDLVAIERMSQFVQRVWAATSACNASGNCPNRPTHFLRYRGKRFLLACDQHAQAAAEQGRIFRNAKPRDNKGAMTLGEVLDRLYDSEINCSISSFWDNGFDVKLGDEINGYAAETLVETTAEAAAWLDAQARRLYPRSRYATGVARPGESENGHR